MIRLTFGVETLSRTRLSVSPAMEAMQWLRLAATGRSHPAFGAPGPAARDVLGHPDVALRAVLLTDLDVARSTAELATRHALAASTVSYHLRALHRAALVTRHRDGRHVLYRRTERAARLLELPPDGNDPRADRV
ncbi:helix-turn-helix domain-containing protein [Dactylosporangium sp. NPDC049742]|uniref:ArsR/SmtB family transcription factor n=1 Tax=Dactylosporangium sp. NPDC049742 TaxID=3154737 RepID=UPI003428391F